MFQPVYGIIKLFRRTFRIKNNGYEEFLNNVVGENLDMDAEEFCWSLRLTQVYPLPIWLLITGLSIY